MAEASPRCFVLSPGCKARGPNVRQAVTAARPSSNAARGPRSIAREKISMKLISVLMVAVALAMPLAAHAAWEVGPPVGSKVPPLHVIDLKGAPVTLRDVAGKNGVVLVFFRSAKWCPYCQRQLMELKDAPGPLAERGYKLAALSYDPTDVLTRF